MAGKRSKNGDGCNGPLVEKLKNFKSHDLPLKILRRLKATSKLLLGTS